MRFQYSNSTLNLYENCPYAFKLKKVDKLPEVSSPPLLVGSSSHTIFDQYAKHCIARKVEMDPDATSGLLDPFGLTLPKGLFDDLRGIAYKFVQTHTFPVGKNIQTELQIALREDWSPASAWYGKDVFFRAVLDKVEIDGLTAVITDYKTNRQIPSGASMRKDPQLPTYAFALKQIHPELKNLVVVLDFVRYGVQLPDRLISLAEIEKVPAQIMEKVRKVEAAEEFKPRASSWCGLCGYKKHCPLFQKAQTAKAPAIIGNAEAARKLGELVALQKIALAENTAAIKAWVKQQGNIPVGDQEWAFVASTEMKFDPAIVVNFLTKAGLDRAEIWEILSATKTQLKKTLKSMGHLGVWDELKKEAEVIPKTKFKLHKPEGVEDGN